MENDNKLTWISLNQTNKINDEKKFLIGAHHILGEPEILNVKVWDSDF